MLSSLCTTGVWLHEDDATERLNASLQTHKCYGTARRRKENRRHESRRTSTRRWRRGERADGGRPLQIGLDGGASSGHAEDASLLTEVWGCELQQRPLALGLQRKMRRAERKRLQTLLTTLFAAGRKEGLRGKREMEGNNEWRRRNPSVGMNHIMNSTFGDSNRLEFPAEFLSPVVGGSTSDDLMEIKRSHWNNDHERMLNS